MKNISTRLANFSYIRQGEEDRDQQRKGLMLVGSPGNIGKDPRMERSVATYKGKANLRQNNIGDIVDIIN